MGMYDVIELYCECPYCKTVGNLVAQTKDLACCLDTYDSVPFFEADKFIETGKLGLNGNNVDNTTSYLHGLDSPSEKMKCPRKGITYVSATGECKSVKCQFDADRRDILRQGCPSGCGRLFSVKIPVIRGCFVSRLDDVVKDGYTEKKLATYREKPEVAKKLEKLMKIYGQEVVAVRFWNKS